MNDAEFRLYILKLEKELKECKQKLFLNRFYKLYKKNIQPCISNIKIDIDHKNNDWVISYEHYTNNYSINNYTINNAEIYDNNLNYNKQANNITTKPNNITTAEPNNITTADADAEKKKTIISFGKSKKYFIRGGIRYNIYRNSSGDLRIINSDYDLELDMEEQYELISNYANNVNIPECLALSIFIYLSDNNWDDTNLITYLSVV